MTRQGAIEAIAAWREGGCEYASIVDGVPRPWPPKPFELIVAEAKQRNVELLSLTNRDHVESIIAAIIAYVERSLIASQATAELRKSGSFVARGGST